MATVTLVAVAARVIPDWFARRVSLRAGVMTLEPKVLPAGIPKSLPSLVLGKIEVDAQVFVRNATPLDLTLSDVQWRAYLSGRQVASGTLPDGQKLPAEAEEKVRLTALVSAPALGLAAFDLLRVQTADVEVEVDATVRALGIPVRRTMRFGGFDLRMLTGGLTDPSEAPPAEPPAEPSAEPPAKPSAKPTDAPPAKPLAKQKRHRGGSR